MNDVPDLKLLRLFDAIYRERNLTRAATKLDSSQPTMSRSLAELRALFDDPLFVRSKGALVPTPRASELAPEIEALLERARTLVTRTRFEPERLERTFVVATSDLVELQLSAGLIAAVQKRAPHVDVVFRTLGRDAGDQLAGVDLLIGVRMGLPANAITAHLFDDSFLCAVRRGHPAAKRRLTVAAYASLTHVQIAPGGQPGGPVEDALAKRGLARRVAVRTPSFLVGPLVAARSDLILTAPSRLLRPMAKTFGLVTFPPPLPVSGFSVHQAWHPRAQRDPAHAWFRGLLAEVARD
jgi:DNA-binding transcriptional LysR family regulator